jgi:TBC1 domain family member 13
VEHKSGVSNQHAIHLMNCLAESKSIQLDRLRELSFFGISDEIKGLRPLIWRILLNYLPTDDTDSWEELLRQKKAIYEMWKDELIIKPKLSIKDRFSEESKETQPKKLSLLDHPLSTQANS